MNNLDWFSLFAALLCASVSVESFRRGKVWYGVILGFLALLNIGAIVFK